MLVSYQKSKNVALRSIYIGVKRQYTTLCSCGYQGESGSVCPNCGANTINLFSFSEHKSKRVVLIDDEYKEKSFHVTKTEGVFSLQGENKALSFTVSDVYETDYDFMREDRIQIRHNGEQIKATKKNVARALSYIEVNGETDSIFSQMKKCCRIALLREQVELLNANPGIEVLYSTYKNLDMLKYVDTTGLNGNATKPNTVMGLGKDVWKRLQSSKIADAGRYLSRIQNAENKYGSARVCEFFDLADILYDKRVWADRIFYAVYDLFFKYRYDGDRLMKYLIDDIRFFQGITDPGHGAQELRDYVDMCSEMGVRYEKYPRSLKLAHDVADMNLDIVCDEKMTEAFKSRVEDPAYKKLECRFGDCIVMAPETPQDLIKEGRELHHCVAAYIDAVINGEAAIYFLRKKSEPDTSFITLDVRNGALYQAAGFANRQLEPEETLLVQQWCLKKKIRME